MATIAKQFPLPWSHYVKLLAVKSSEARAFYEAEALRGGWTVRQLDRQINSLFYERTALSRNKAAMLTKGAKPKPEDAVTPEEEIKDPLLLEFLGLWIICRNFCLILAMSLRLSGGKSGCALMTNSIARIWCCISGDCGVC